MDVEVRSFDSVSRKLYSEKLTTLKKSFATTKQEFESIKFELQKSSLLGNGKSSVQR